MIFKNLVRDLRKFYSQDFNQVNLKKIKKLYPSNFKEALEGYTKLTLKDQLESLQISMKDLVFNLGSLIYPKLMLKMLKNNAVEKV